MPLDRRRFLKYAGATVAVVGASALGLDYLLNGPRIPDQQINETLTPTSSSFSTTTVSTVSSSSTRLVSLEGRLFFDYNGNGIQDGDEPSVQNATVQIKDSNAQVIAQALTDSSGDYKIDIPAGNYKLFIQPDQSKPANPNFTHMCTSPSDLRAITDDYDLAVVADDTFNVGLMEGMYTQPFRSSTDYYVACYYNWDSRSNETLDSPYLWWNGESGYNYDLDLYNNAGIDMPMEVGTDVLAPAPGIMGGIQKGPLGQIGLGISHGGAFGVGSFGTFFNHLSQVLLPDGATFARGDVIAKSGMTGTHKAHLHMNNSFPYPNETGYAYFDFYQPEFEITPKTSGFWSPETIWNSVPLGMSPNGKNLWTRKNKPAFFE